MATPGNPLGPDNQRELFEFLRQQSEANRTALRDEAEANRAAQLRDAASIRNLFITTSTIVAIPLGAALALAGYLGFKDMNSMTVILENEAKNSEQVEIAKINSDIDKTLQEQFSTSSMQDRIARAAEEATEGKAKNLIEDRVRTITEPIQKQAQTAGAAIHIQELIASANADNAKAYDELLTLRNTADSAQRILIEGAITDRHRNELFQAYGPSQAAECAAPLSPDFVKRVSSTDVSLRKNAIASCDAFLNYQDLDTRFAAQPDSGLNTEWLIPPILANAALNDDSLSVRYEAIMAFSHAFIFSPGFPHDGLDPLDSKELKKWWEENQSHYRQLQLLSLVAPRESTRGNMITLYDEVNKDANTAPEPLRKEFVSAKERMEDQAKTKNGDSKKILEKNVESNGCGQIMDNFASDLDSNPFWANMTHEQYSQDISYSAELSQLQYVTTCEPDPDARVLRKLAATMVQTHLLDKRYGIVMVVNRWTGSNLDPFDTNAIHQWWEQHKATLGN